MGKTLVICETRTRAETLGRALGGRLVSEPRRLEGARLVLTWTAGAVAALASPEVYDPKLKTWEIADLPIVPERFELVARPGEESAGQLREIRALVRRADVEQVIDACEPGLDGALVFGALRELAELGDVPVEHAALQSLARPAIRRAFAGLRSPGARGLLEDAARARAEADWLIGVNGTRAATVRARALGGRSTIGRLQTPLLALLVRRQRELEAFEPSTYHALDAAFEPGSGSSRYLAHWFRGDETGRAAPAPADEIAALVRGGTGRVRELETRSEPQPAPPLYLLGELQSDAARDLSFTAKRTLDAALECYEEAVLSYPRPAASGNAPADDVREIAAHVGRASVAYRDPAALVASGTEPPPAHPAAALIPTNGPHRLASLGDDARRLYDLVARRFLAACLPAARVELTIVVTEVAGETFRAQGRVVRVPGWHEAYGGGVPGDATTHELPALQPGDEVHCARVERSERSTPAPEPFGDASLLAAMSIADHPDALERLIGLGYVVREGRFLRPTDKGVQLVDLIGEHAITSPEHAGALERRLRAIEGGEEERAPVMAEVVAATVALVEHLRELPDDRTRFPRRDLGVVCPRCGNGTLIENRKGFGCSTWSSREEPGCGFVIWKTLAGRPIDEAIVRELVARGRTRELTGFRSRAGRPFRASLVLEPADAQPVTFAFAPREGGGATGRTRA